MDKEFIPYTLADGQEVFVEVMPMVKDFLEQSDRADRSQQRQDRRYVDYPGSLENMKQAVEPDIIDLILKNESDERLYKALNKLTDIQRRRLLMHYADNLTYATIAELEGVKSSTVYESIQAALNKLSQHLTN